MLTIRQMQAFDLPAVVKLQDRCYSAELFEPAELLKRRFSAFPQSCWVACYQKKLWGYLFCYPAKLGKVNALAADFQQMVSPDCLYLHDIAVSLDARGQGVAQQLLATAEQYAAAKGLHQLALVAVQNSALYWQQRGFTAFNTLSANDQQNLASYSGQQALYLTKTL